MQSYARCRELNKAYGTTYYAATFLLPRVKRHHVHALYGFCRYADDIVDDLGPAPVEVREQALADFGDRFFADLAAATPTTRCSKAVVHTVQAFSIDPDCFRRFLRSMAMDLTVASYETFDDLLDYMDGSAAVIGEMMLPILEPSQPAGAAPRPRPRHRVPAHELPARRGEDLDRGRVYLPQEDLRRFGADPRASASHARVAGAHGVRDRAHPRVLRVGRPRRADASRRLGAVHPCGAHPLRRDPRPDRGGRTPTCSRQRARVPAGAQGARRRPQRRQARDAPDRAAGAIDGRARRRGAASSPGHHRGEEPVRRAAVEVVHVVRPAQPAAPSRSVSGSHGRRPVDHDVVHEEVGGAVRGDADADGHEDVAAADPDADREEHDRAPRRTRPGTGRWPRAPCGAARGGCGASPSPKPWNTTRCESAVNGSISTSAAASDEHVGHDRVTSPAGTAASWDHPRVARPAQLVPQQHRQREHREPEEVVLDRDVPREAPAGRRVRVVE